MVGTPTFFTTINISYYYYYYFIFIFLYIIEILISTHTYILNFEDLRDQIHILIKK